MKQFATANDNTNYRKLLWTFMAGSTSDVRKLLENLLRQERQEHKL